MVGVWAVLLAAPAGVPARGLNGCGPCSLVATMKADGGTALFDGTASSVPLNRSANVGFQVGDSLSWRLAFRDLGTVQSARVRLGTATDPGRYLFTLCAPCVSGAHATRRLGPALVKLFNTLGTCHANRSPSESWPLCAYITLALAGGAQRTVGGQLRYCAPNQYRHRNSCAPPGY